MATMTIAMTNPPAAAAPTATNCAGVADARIIVVGGVCNLLEVTVGVTAAGVADARIIVVGGVCNGLLEVTVDSFRFGVNMPLPLPSEPMLRLFAKCAGDFISIILLPSPSSLVSY